MKNWSMEREMKLFTIGFTRKSAETFFTHLKASGVRRLIDTRLNNRSQLAGFAKKTDLQYFLREIGQIDYLHLPQLAPTQDILDAYKKQKGAWETYEQSFRALMAARKIEEEFTPELFENACLLCSEHQPDHCHRRLVAEYLRDKWGGIEIKIDRTSSTQGSRLIVRCAPLPRLSLFVSCGREQNSG